MLYSKTQKHDVSLQQRPIVSLQQRHIVSLQQRHIVFMDDTFNVFGTKWVEHKDIIMKLDLPDRIGLPHLSGTFPESQIVVVD